MRLLTMNIILYGAAPLLLSARGHRSGPSGLRGRFDSANGARQNEVVVGVRITGAQLRISRWPLKEYLAMAYRLRPQQISGPDSISALYDISATIPRRRFTGEGSRDAPGAVCRSICAEGASRERRNSLFTPLM
jgi:hypothetical protein